MNAHVAISPAQPIRLTASAYHLLQGFGAFNHYWQTELLDGQLWGVPSDDGDEPDSDATYPIKLTTEHYELLDRAGIFLNHARTELIDGRVYPMSPQYRPHGFVKDQLAYRLRRALEAMDSTLSVATEQSVKLAPHHEPQPDIILTTEPFGSGAIPGDSVALIVEVSDTTGRYDRTQKAIIYADAAVAEYWVADVQKRRFYRFWHPERAQYKKRDRMDFDVALTSMTIAGLTIAAEGL